MPRRAEKFGVEYVDPAESRVYKQQALAERHADSGFSTGFDIFTKDEIEKRKQRAERFNLPEDAGLSWKGSEVVEDEEKKRQRAERFGTTYHPDAADGGLMDVGTCGGMVMRETLLSLVTVRLCLCNYNYTVRPLHVFLPPACH